jgi:hypothetical protein
VMVCPLSTQSGHWADRPTPLGASNSGYLMEKNRRSAAKCVLAFANSASGQQIMRYSAFAVIAMATWVPISPAAAISQDEGVLLSRSDYVYLTSQGVQANSPVLQSMSPKELRHLHWIINDERTQKNPVSRSGAVRGALAEFKDHQVWEKMNPGHLWDEKRHEAPGMAVPN